MTASGCPFVEWLALTSSQLEACLEPARAWRKSREPIELSLGIGCGAGVSVTSVPRMAEVRDAPAGGSTGSPSLTNVTEPGSGIASPAVANGEPVSYGNDC